MGKERFLRISGSIVFITLASYISLALIIYLFQSHYIYFPERRIDATPKDIGLAFEESSLVAADGVKLSSWYIPAEKPRGVLLFCHGNGGNISHRLESIRIFNRLGLSVLIFDYRGYGQSEGSPTEEGTYLDAEAAYRFLVDIKRVEPARIVIFGRSLGGSVAAWVARRHSAGALIVESSFTSVADIAADIYPWLPVQIMTMFNYRTVDYIRQLNCPVFVIHSSDDEMIPITHGRRLFEAAKEPKKFLEISGGHNDGFITTGKRYEEGLDSFLSDYLQI